MRPLVHSPRRPPRLEYPAHRCRDQRLLLAVSALFGCALTAFPRGAGAFDSPFAEGLPQPVLTGLNGPVEAAVCFDRTLVVGGAFSAAGGVQTGPLACWNGFKWLPMGAALDAPVHALAVFQGELIAAGEFLHAGGVPVAHVARWNGRTWEPLGLGTDGPVHALAVQADVILYAGGEFSRAGSAEAHGVARYLMGTWSSVGSGVNGQVRALAVYNGALVAGGDFALFGSPGYDRYLARFTNGTWQILAWGVDAPVSALALYNGSLVAGGAFTQIDFVTPARGIAAFIGETWNEIGVGVASENGVAEVRSLWADGTGLIVGGAFEAAGLGPARNVAHWDGESWNALDEGMNGAVTALMAYGPVLVAGGAFTRAGQGAADCVAALANGRWFALEQTPIAVQDVVISRAAGAVRLEWSLDPAALDGVGGVVVERAPDADASGTPVTRRPLAPARRMVAIDVEPDPACAWYRIVLVETTGQRTVGATVQAPEFAATQTAIHSVVAHGTQSGVVISYAVATRGAVQLDVYDVRGRRLAPVVHGLQDPGAYAVAWPARDERGTMLSHGVYFARLQAGDGQSVRKFQLRAGSW